MNIKTVGIIGGGVSGLSAGVLLARRGFQVKVYEANAKVGGCCANTNLSGYTFNDGAMYLAVPEILDYAFEADAAITALSRIHKMDIAVKRIVSPKDYQDRMHLHGGAVYGLSLAASSGAQFPPKTPIHGLFQAGQTAYPGYGAGPAAMSGVFAAEALMKTVSL